MELSLPNGLRVNIGQDFTRLCTWHEIFYLRNYGSLHLQAHDMVLDCGANIGLFALYVANRVGHVVSVEPLTENYRIFIENMKRNGLSEAVTSYQLAVTDKHGEGFMVDHGGRAKFVTDCCPGSERAKCVTVDELEKMLQLKFDVVKIDVEGSEAQVLRGAEQALNHVREIIIETHSDALRKECQNLLSAKGFQVSIPRRHRDLKWLVGYVLMNLQQAIHSQKPLFFNILSSLLSVGRKIPSQLNILYAIASERLLHAS